MKNYLDAFDNSRLHLIIFPTEKCNFNCFYCYEDFKIGKMPPGISDSIIKLISSRVPELKHLTIGWFGGEPLIAADIIKRLSEDIIEMTMQGGIELFDANITTNGYLLDAEMLKNLVKWNVNSFQISLDGDEEEHNKTRILRNGKGTFGKIWNNLIMAKHSDYDIEFIIRVHYHSENSDKLDPLIEKLNIFREDSRFKIFFKSIERLGGENDGLIQLVAPEEKEKIKRNLYSKINNEKIEGIDFDDNYVCYAAKPNSLIIKADGKVSKCTVALNDDRNYVGNLLEDGTIRFREDKLKLWFKGYENMDFNMLSCPHVNM